MSNIQTIAEGLRKECREDEVGLWEIIHEVRCQNISDAKNAVIDIVRLLLSDSEIKAGTWNTSEKWRFKLWPCSTEATVARIADEWEKLGHDPRPGGIVYFTCPALRGLPTE